MQVRTVKSNYFETHIAKIKFSRNRELLLYAILDNNTIQRVHLHCSNEGARTASLEMPSKQMRQNTVALGMHAKVRPSQSQFQVFGVVLGVTDLIFKNQILNHHIPQELLCNHHPLLKVEDSQTSWHSIIVQSRKLPCRSSIAGHPLEHIASLPTRPTDRSTSEAICYHHTLKLSTFEKQLAQKSSMHSVSCLKNSEESFAAFLNFQALGHG